MSDHIAPCTFCGDEYSVTDLTFFDGDWLCPVCHKELTEEQEAELCSNCNGSGEGQYDGTICTKCKGRGIVEVEK